jgi:hypothetical protein
LFALFSATDKVRRNQEGTEGCHGEIKEYLETLRVVEVQPGCGYVPEKANHRATREHHDAGDILGAWLSASASLVARIHRGLPMLK